MPKYTPEQIYAAAAKMLPQLEAGRRRQVQDLLEQAKRHKSDTHLQILELLTAEESTREQLLSYLKTGESERTLGEFVPLPGPPPSTRGQLFVCPVEGCDYVYAIAEAGEDPGKCLRHHLRLIPQQEKE